MQPLLLALPQHDLDGRHGSLHLGPAVGLDEVQPLPLSQGPLGEEHVLLLVQDVPEPVQVVEGLATELRHRPLPAYRPLGPVGAREGIAELVEGEVRGGGGGVRPRNPGDGRWDRRQGGGGGGRAGAAGGGRALPGHGGEGPPGLGSGGPRRQDKGRPRR